MEENVVRKPGILEVFVRSPQTPPPINQPFCIGGRLTATVLLEISVILVYYLHFFRAYRFVVSFGSFMLVNQITFALDGLVSNSFGSNIQNLRRAGYSDVAVLLFMEFNLFLSQLIGYGIIVFIVTDPAVYTTKNLWFRLADPVGAPRLAFSVAINLALSEVLFTFSHSQLHKVPVLVSYYVFHHCSTKSSWNTNVLFHPVDLVLEFAGPAAGLLVLHYTLWRQDQFVLLATYLVFQIWYALDHDEELQLWHIQHHSECNSLYSIYTPWKQAPSSNLLRRHMRERGLLQNLTKSRI